MTPAKLAALELLATEPRFTWKHTTKELIGGRVAACLAREGFARDVSVRVWWSEDPLPKYEITDAGREALARRSAP